ncbi:uracil-DNA glycosylase, family 4 [Hartmannibacter diazotrophicus]|uniref:Type-5 uracil-DNA glycosylase n=1 Tax=Hartmannibacter diazotrophicus TaxID=1482074 RepID=A0A2C9D840_9HYPH|nr:uracil-DNA glycosylase [Hartmannibacter diazotrophicus]SON56298.1 uracil-DNA glycosylase, family 4 [Hartmannibacter diazotrophicus]
MNRTALFPFPDVDPGRDCPLCPRLVAFRQSARAEFPDWHNAPVPTFGAADASLLVVGLAPGLRGANRTGRPFTGDYAGDLLYDTLIRFGFAAGSFEARIDDSLTLVGAAVTNAVRCVPPENKPVGAEINACRPFLTETIGKFRNLKAIVALGRIAHDSTLKALKPFLSASPSAYTFSHGAMHRLSGPNGPLLFADSYHCSRYNTNTGRLTPEMFRDVFSAVRAEIDSTS